MKKENKLILYLYIIFIVLHPFLEIYYLYMDNYKFFGLSISTIIRTFLVLILFVLCFKRWDNKNKYKYFFLFVFINVIYSILHISVSNNFNVVSLSKTFSLMGEISYLMKMFVPLLFIFISYYVLKNFKINKIVITILAIEIILMIIIPSLFGFSILSYGGKQEYSMYSILDWFKGIFVTVPYEKIGVKGIFYQANPLGATLAIMISLVNYCYFKYKNSKLLFIITLLNICSMMLGTRVGTYIWLIIEAGYVLFYFLSIFMKKQKFSINFFIKYFIVLFVSVVLMFFSPGANRNKYAGNNAGNANIENNNDPYIKIDYDENMNDEEKVNVCNLIRKKYNIYGYQLVYFSDNYKCESDVEFWLNYGKLEFEKKDDGRKIQALIIKRVSILNKANFDELFGIGRTNLHNSKVYLENDILWQYYTLGIFGIIIYLLPYLIIAFLGFKKAFINMTLEKALLPVTIVLAFAVSYLSGNSFDSWLYMFIMSMVCGMILVDIRKDSGVLDDKD